MSELKILSIAWRNLWRQKRRSALTLLSIAFGLFLTIVMTSMQDRSFSDFIDTAARLGTGHVTIQNAEYMDSPTLTHTVSPSDDLRATADAQRFVRTAVDRTSGQAMLSTASDSFGALFIAYDPEMETKETFDYGDMVEGSWFSTAKDKGIILGVTLARNLDAKLGDKVVYTLTDVNGEIVNGMERLSGIVRSGSPSLDAGLVLLPIDTVRKTLGYTQAQTTQVAVFLSDSRKSPAVARSLVTALNDDRTAVLTWDQIQPELKTFIAMKVGGARFMEMVIGLLVAAGIFNTMFMSVMERSREFGIMLALGWSPGQLFRMVMWEAACLAVVGLAVGGLVTAWPYYTLSKNGIDMSGVYTSQPGAQVDIGGVGFDPILKFGIFPENAMMIIVLVIVATLLAGVYPAWKAGRVDPVESINVA